MNPLTTADSPLRTLLFLIQLGAAAYTLWFGLYVIARVRLFAGPDWRAQRPGTYMGVTMVLLGVYLLGIAMETVATTAAEFLLWQRLTWWTSAVGVALFLLAVIRWREERRERTALPAAVDAVWMSIATVVAAGTVLGWYSAPDRVSLGTGMLPVYFTPPRVPAYFIFAGFVLGQLALVVLLLLNQRRQGDDASRRTLPAAALAILAGAAIGVIGIPGLNQGGVPRMLGTPGIAAGAALTGYAMVRHLAFVQTRSVVRDFKLALLNMTAQLVVFIGGFVVVFAVLPYKLEPAVMSTLVCLLVLTSALSSLQDRWPARLILPAWAVEYRAQVGLLRDEPLLARAPAAALAGAGPQMTRALQQAATAQQQEAVQQAVGELFRYNRFHDDAFLAQSPLPRLLHPDMTVTAPPTPVDAARLRARLVSAIDAEIARFTPGSTSATCWRSTVWRCTAARTRVR